MTVKNPAGRPKISTEISLPDQFKTAIALVDRATAVTAIATRQEYDKAAADYRELIQNEKELDIQFKKLQCVIDYNDAKAKKADLAAKFDTAKKHLKNGPMRAFDEEQERLRLEEQNRLAKIEQEKRDAETARLEKIEQEKQAAAEKERKRLEAIAAKTKDEEKKKQALLDAAAAAERAEAARLEQEAIKQDAAAAPVATVIVEKSHAGVSRRKVFKWRLTTKDRRQFTKDSMKDSDRLGRADLPTIPPHLFVVSRTLLNEHVDSQGESAAIPGVLEVTSEMV